MVRLKAAMSNAEVSLIFLKKWGHVTFELGKPNLAEPVWQSILVDINRREVTRKWFH